MPQRLQSIVFPLAAVCVIAGFLGWTGRFPWKRITPLVGAAGVAALLLCPWLFGHNFRHTGRLTPTPADFPVDSRVALPRSALRTVLTLPGLTPGELNTPYAHLWESQNDTKNS